MASCAVPVACKPVKIGEFHYYDGGLTDAVPVQKVLDDGCDRLVVILSKPRDFVRKPQGFRFMYSRICRHYLNIVSAIDDRHVAYNANLKRVYELEKWIVCFDS
jgi:predicted patatin/cPLA2 family phospholipase